MSMNAPNKNRFSFQSLSVACAIALVAGIAGSPAMAKKTVAPSADDQAIVQCQLPPQIRTLGNHATYLAAGPLVHTSIADCKIRGGKYDGHGPGAFAGQDTAAASGGRVAVTVGGDKSRAGCPKSGTVSGISAKGALSVRVGPSATADRLDKLGNGKRLFMCDWSSDGAWVGVVYASAGSVDCGVSSPILQPQPYAGACRSGWVSAKYVK
jgi:hypothetical protein